MRGCWRDLDALVEPTSRGDPMSALRWTCKSTTRLAEELNRLGHRVSQRTICDLLAQMGYSLQSVRKTREGAQHPDRDAQFHYIADKVALYQRQRQPVISVDTKKKELIGDFRNAGREWQPKGQPEQARVHDFIDDELGKVAPYGVYDVTANEGWVSVGINQDTAGFAVQSIRRWVAGDGPSVVSESQAAADHRRLRWQQRISCAAVAGAVAATGRRARLRCAGVPLPAGHKQVEQDRASPVLPYHEQLARQTAVDAPGGSEPHRQREYR